MKEEALRVDLFALVRGFNALPHHILDVDPEGRAIRADIVAIHERVRGILLRHRMLLADEAILPPFGPNPAQP